MKKHIDIQNEINRLAKEYAQIVETSEAAKIEKLRIFNNAVKIYLSAIRSEEIKDKSEDEDKKANSKSITDKGKFKKLKRDWDNISDCAAIIESVCLEKFFICFTDYDAELNDNFMAYFYTSAYNEARNELRKTACKIGIQKIKSSDQSDSENFEFDKKQNLYKSIVDHYHDINEYDLSSDIRETEHICEEKETLSQLTNLLASSIIIFCEHRDTQKSTVATALKYYKTFYTGDIINVIKTQNIFEELIKHEQKITKSYNADFIDYVMKDKPRSLTEIKTAALKLYKELNASRTADSKMDKQINLPFEKVIYALFLDVKKPFISKKYAEYKDFLKETMTL